MKLLWTVLRVCIVGLFVLWSGVVVATEQQRAETLNYNNTAELYAISSERIAAQRAVYFKELTSHANVRKITIATSGAVALIALSFLLYEYQKPVVAPAKKNEADAGISLEEAFTRVKLEEFLRREEDIPLLQLLQKYIKQGFAYAVGTVSALFFMGLLTDIKDSFSLVAWRRLLYKTDFEGFVDRITEADQQASALEDFFVTMRTHLASAPLVDELDCAEFKEFFLPQMVDTMNLLTRSFEQLIAYLAACVDVLAPEQGEILSEFIAQSMKSLVFDLHAMVQEGQRLLSSVDGQQFARQCVTVERRIKKIAVRLHRVTTLLGERVYGQSVQR